MWMSKEQRLYVADSLNRRVQVFDVVPEEGQDKDLFVLP
jgi:sugar lactone lactonase YvrE